jgi:hypothetical protein
MLFAIFCAMYIHRYHLSKENSPLTFAKSTDIQLELTENPRRRPPRKSKEFESQPVARSEFDDLPN